MRRDIIPHRPHAGSTLSVAHGLLKATNDYLAILAWLRSKTGPTPDQKAHLKARRRQRDTGVEQGMD